MSVRDPGFDPRNRHPRSGAHPVGGPRPRATVPPLARARAILVAAAALAARHARRAGLGSLFGAGPSASPLTGLASPVVAGGPDGLDGSVGLADRRRRVAGAGRPAVTSPPRRRPPPARSPTRTSRSPRSSRSGPAARPRSPPTSPASRPAARRSRRSSSSSATPTAILAALGLDRAALGDRLVTVPTAKALATDLAGHPNRIGFLRADEVGAVGARRRVGGQGAVRRAAGEVARGLAARRHARGAGPGSPTYDPATAWTMFAGGDILLDRGVALAIGANGTGFPFDGGTAEITGLCKDCSPMGWDTPYTRRTGNARRRARPDLGRRPRHRQLREPGTEPVLVPRRAGRTSPPTPPTSRASRTPGIDWVSLANNHIGDQGRTGRAPDDRATSTTTASSTAGAGRERRRGAQGDPDRRRRGHGRHARLRRDRPGLQRHAPTRPAARGSRRPPSRPTSRPRARPAPTS